MGAAALGVMAGSQALGALGAYQQSKLQKTEYNYNAQVARNNQQLAEYQAQDALTRGDLALRQHGRDVSQLQGRQRAAMAASGIRLDTGSPLSILTDTDTLGKMDAQTIRANAEREAYGYQVQAQNYGAQADLLKYRAKSENPLFAGVSSLLTGAGKVGGQYAMMSKAGALG